MKKLAVGLLIRIMRGAIIAELDRLGLEERLAKRINDEIDIPLLDGDQEHALVHSIVEEVRQLIRGL